MEKYSGTYTEIDDDFVFTEYDIELSTVIVTESRIALDWIEDGEHFATTICPSMDGDVEIWRGNLQSREHPGIIGKVTAKRYLLVEDAILLIAKWSFADREGKGLFEIDRE